MVQAEHGAADLRLLLEQVEPRDRSSPRTGRPATAGTASTRTPASVSWVISSWNRAASSASQSFSCGVGRREPGELDVRRQVADLDHGRDARAVERRAEQLVDQQRLVGRERLGRRRGQAEDHRVGQLVEQLAQQPAPDLEQVVALVEHEQQRPGGAQLLDERLAVVVQAGEQRAGPAAWAVR